ncbi:hypothetical protein WAK64_12550 [Bacillus spongiae]|uniref:Uncharacterized protein n=1 Tax=Bacillus spongiae TaxID=2683610 RepID=A0ABU8HEU4_9BACI
MKKKGIILILTVFFLITSAFYYHGAPSETKATQSPGSAQSTENTSTNEIIDSSSENYALADGTDSITSTDELVKADDINSLSTTSNKVNLMDSEKFADLAKIATKHNGILYGLESSDILFIEREDNEVIFVINLFHTKAALEYSDIQIDYFKEYISDFTDKGIIENIKLVEDTHGQIEAKFEIGGYSIYTDENYLHVIYDDYTVNN